MAETRRADAPGLSLSTPDTTLRSTGTIDREHSTGTYRVSPRHDPDMLTCRACGREYADDASAPWRCPCGHALDFADRPLPDDPDPPPPPALDRDRGLWAFDEFLPVEPRVSFGEGWTPLVDAPEWDVTFKLESVCPTGSFKDRGAAATVSRAVGHGTERVVEDSSGNAGLATATYAARAGVDAEIYVPAGAKPGKIGAIERTGADVVRVEGDRGEVTDACVGAVESGEGWYASHAWDPAFLAGTSTFALELAAVQDWTVPDAVVLPVGHGTLLLGAYRGFRALVAAGWTDRVPRLLGAQAAGTAPVVEALDSDGDEAAGGAATAPGPDTDNDMADGIRIREPARRDQILDAVAATGGGAVAVGPDATAREHDRLARAGFHVEPTSATATAALEAYRDRGVIDADEDVVVALTGTGLKG